MRIQRNLSVETGLVRNARVRITALHRRLVKVQLLHNLENHCIPRITFSFHPYRFIAQENDRPVY
ncbi:hypothetical protein C8R48DRAFT_711457 [Suillus tomentosus]|nr:hypothetical protein C8R48DRAFT_711457 [Suillus tomentosus]